MLVLRPDLLIKRNGLTFFLEVKVLLNLPRPLKRPEPDFKLDMLKFSS
jgi:hypothetical protein